SHPLQRLEQLAGFGGEFAQLEAYEKSFTEHAKKLAEYQEAFEKFLAWHRERGDGAKPAAEAAPPSERRGGRRGRREDPPAEGSEPAPAGEGGRPPAAEGGTPPAGQPEAKPAAAASNGKPAEPKAPERPKYPPEPKRDPAKDALIAVRDGERACFVEARRADEVERALELAREHGIPRVVLEHATGAARAVDAIAKAGVPVIVDTALPPALDRRLPEQ